MQKVPLNDLLRHTRAMQTELEAACQRVVQSGWYILGPEVEAFENEFRSYCGTEACVSVGNGTDALELALRALDVGPGDSVATVANAGMYSTTAICSVQAIPAYVEVDKTNLTMSSTSLVDIIKRVKAVIVTHLYGQMADMDSILRIANEAKVPVIEDCAQAHGAIQNGRRAGSMGTIGTFSFYPTKNLGGMGDGGAIVTSNLTIANKVRQLRQYGWSSKYRASIPGGRNSRLDEMTAAVLRSKLNRLDGWNQRRRTIASAYRSSLRNVTVPQNASESYVAHLFVIRTDRREELRTKLNELGVGSEVHYPIADYAQEAHQLQPWARVRLEQTERACNEVLSLPCFPELTDNEVQYVIEAVNKAV